MNKYFINNEEVKKATFQESMNESIQDLNEYEIELIADTMQYHVNVPIQINGLNYRIECEESEI
jgi:hypothetical protein